MSHIKSNSKTSKTFRMIICSILAISGCQNESADPLAPQGYNIRYEWGFINCSKDDFEDVTLFLNEHGVLKEIGSAGFMSHADDIRKLSMAGYQNHLAPRCIPEFLTMKWKRGNEAFSQQVDLRETMQDPCTFKGTVYFYYQHRAWHAMPISTEEENRYALHGLPRFPKLELQNVEITD